MLKDLAVMVLHCATDLTRRGAAQLEMGICGVAFSGAAHTQWGVGSAPSPPAPALSGRSGWPLSSHCQCPRSPRISSRTLRMRGGGCSSHCHFYHKYCIITPCCCCWLCWWCRCRGNKCGPHFSIISAFSAFSAFFPIILGWPPKYIV